MRLLPLRPILHVQNTLTNQRTALQGAVTWYCCGPTTYDASHLGHARNYVAWDIARRIMQDTFSLPVLQVINITDVDDKIVARSKERQVPPVELARHFEHSFVNNMAQLNVLPPTQWMRATEHMEPIQAMVADLIDKGFAYPSQGSVYFDITAFENAGFQYGKLRPSAVDTVDSSDGPKQSSRDFALWRGCDESDLHWKSPWGPGRPGWHIECSAMAAEAFGPSLLLHTGGADLAFPHHMNEIAQSEAAFGLKDGWADVFLHCGHLHIEGRKMSKSLKNFITIDEFLGKHGEENGSDLWRMFCLMHHYSAQISFGEQQLVEARRVLKRLIGFADQIADSGTTVERRWGERADALWDLRVQSKTRVLAALADDFDTPLAIRTMLDLVKSTNAIAQGGPLPLEILATVADDVRGTLRMLGLRTAGAQGKRKSASPDPLDVLVQFRDATRKAALGPNPRSDVLAACDQLRNGPLKEMGVDARDGKG